MWTRTNLKRKYKRVLLNIFFSVKNEIKLKVGETLFKWNVHKNFKFLIENQDFPLPTLPLSLLPSYYIKCVRPSRHMACRITHTHTHNTHTKYYTNLTHRHTELCVTKLSLFQVKLHIRICWIFWNYNNLKSFNN